MDGNLKGAQDTLYVVTARAGSKGVPDKNVMLFGGKPALGLRIECIRRFDPGANIVCSTDSAQYAAIAEQFGARAPFLRPAELASDSASSIDVLMHVLDWYRHQQ